MTVGQWKPTEYVHKVDQAEWLLRWLHWLLMQTAEMPGLYQPGEYDVAGFAVGSVKQDRVIDGKQIQEGDVLVALPSSGLHSNGFSLVRKVVEVGFVVPVSLQHHGKCVKKVSFWVSLSLPLIRLVLSVCPVNGCIHSLALVQSIPYCVNHDGTA